jgi:hypothetical protein
MNRIARVFFALLICGAASLFCQNLTDELMDATRKGDVASVKNLLDQGANVNSRSAYGTTPLFLACDGGDVELIKLLLDRGADVNVQDTFYHATALSLAMQKDRVDIIKMLLDRGAKSPGDLLKAGVQNGNAGWVKVALAAKGGVDKASLSSALAAATKASKDDVVEILKAAGAVMAPILRLDDAVLTRYAGTYTAKSNGMDLDFTFTVKDSELSGILLPQPAAAYSPSDATHFVNDQYGVKVEFKIEKGVATGFKFEQGGVAIDFKRKVESQ